MLQSQPQTEHPWTVYKNGKLQSDWLDICDVQWGKKQQQQQKKRDFISLVGNKTYSVTNVT